MPKTLHTLDVGVCKVFGMNTLFFCWRGFQPRSMPKAHAALIWIYRAYKVSLQQENGMVNANIFTHPLKNQIYNIPANLALWLEQHYSRNVTRS